MSNYLIHLTKNIDFDMEINDRITIISGDSSTGKTFIINMMNIIIKMNKVNSVPKPLVPSDFIVCSNEDETFKINNAHHKVIFIDRYDIFSKDVKNMINKKMSQQDNTWIIMSRGTDIKCYGSIALKVLKSRIENGKRVLYLADYLGAKFI